MQRKQFTVSSVTCWKFSTKFTKKKKMNHAKIRMKLIIFLKKENIYNPQSVQTNLKI